MRFTGLISLLAFLSLYGGTVYCDDAGIASPAEAKVAVWFSPNGGCTEAIVEAIGKARKEILVQAYSFTSSAIAKALVKAHDRGVDCKVILDKSQRTEKYSSAEFLSNAGIETLIDWRPRIAHSKAMVIDGVTVITGSFNFTSSAEKSNVENLLVIESPALAGKYIGNWQTRASLAEAYTSKRGM